MKDYWIPIAAGLIAYYCLTYGFVLLAIKADFIRSHDPSMWYFEVSNGIQMLRWIVPGIIAGYLTKKSGIMLGAIIGSLFILITNVIPQLFALNFNTSLGVVSTLIPFVLKTLIVSTLMNAVGGGCGELIRIKRTATFQSINKTI